jgi:hypothetical protein
MFVWEAGSRRAGSVLWPGSISCGWEAAGNKYIDQVYALFYSSLWHLLQIKLKFMQVQYLSMKILFIELCLILHLSAPNLPS